MAWEQALAQAVRLEQAAKIQQRGGVGHACGGQLNAGKALHRLAVMERVFQRLVRQPIPLLEKIDPQHPLQPDGRAAALAVGVERLDDGQQFRPRDDFLHPRKELLAPGDLVLIGELGPREAGLVDHATDSTKPRTDRQHQTEKRSGLIQRFPSNTRLSDCLL